MSFTDYDMQIIEVLLHNQHAKFISGGNVINNGSYAIRNNNYASIFYNRLVHTDRKKMKCSKLERNRVIVLITCIIKEIKM